MVIADTQNLAAVNTPNRSFVAWERRSNNAAEAPLVNGIYFLSIDKNSEGVSDPDTFLNTAIRIIPSAMYNNRDVERLYLYANNDGSDVSISFTVPANGGNQRNMFTGRIVNNQYVPCDGGNPTQLDSSIFGIFGVYFSNNTKIKFVTTTGGITIAEGH